MAYFPLFVELEEKPCLIVGGGTVALRKAEKLLCCGARLTAVAPAFAPGWDALAGRAALLRRAFCPADVDGQTLVIAATDDAAVNTAVAAQCRDARIPVNTVDDPGNCTFLFPALVRRGALCVGISTGGASPTAAADVRRRIEAALRPVVQARLRAQRSSPRCSRPAWRAAGRSTRRRCRRSCPGHRMFGLLHIFRKASPDRGKYAFRGKRYK